MATRHHNCADGASLARGNHRAIRWPNWDASTIDSRHIQAAAPWCPVSGSRLRLMRSANAPARYSSGKAARYFPADSCRPSLPCVAFDRRWLHTLLGKEMIGMARSPADAVFQLHGRFGYLRNRQQISFFSRVCRGCNCPGSRLRHSSLMPRGSAGKHAEGNKRSANHAQETNKRGLRKRARGRGRLYTETPAKTHQIHARAGQGHLQDARERNDAHGGLQAPGYAE
jgi:hypothetical protein